MPSKAGQRLPFFCVWSRERSGGKRYNIYEGECAAELKIFPRLTKTFQKECAVKVALPFSFPFTLSSSCFAKANSILRINDAPQFLFVHMFFGKQTPGADFTSFPSLPFPCPLPNNILQSAYFVLALALVSHCAGLYRARICCRGCPQPPNCRLTHQWPAPPSIPLKRTSCLLNSGQIVLMTSLIIFLPGMGGNHSVVPECQLMGGQWRGLAQRIWSSYRLREGRATERQTLQHLPLSSFTVDTTICAHVEMGPSCYGIQFLGKDGFVQGNPPPLDCLNVGNCSGGELSSSHCTGMNSEKTVCSSQSLSFFLCITLCSSEGGKPSCGTCFQ